MALKLTVSKGDKIIIGDNIVAEVIHNSAKQCTLALVAPEEVKIYTVFKDINKQFKNAKN